MVAADDTTINFINLHQLAANFLLFVQKCQMATASLWILSLKYFGTYVCRTPNLIDMPNFVQMHAVVNEL